MNAAGLARLLVEARGTGQRVGSLDGDLLPASEADAYAVQEETARLLGATIAGWKVGAANATAAPVAAPLLVPLVATSPARLVVAADSFRGVEAELALSLARDLPARATAYSEDEAWDAVAAVHVAIELLDSRYTDRRAMGPAALLADNQSNGGFCYGAAITGWRSIDYATQRARLVIDGKEVKAASGGNPAGHPRRLLAWLANHAASRGRPLKTGDVVTTGSHTGITIAPPGARVIAHFEGLGEAELSLAAT